MKVESLRWSNVGRVGSFVFLVNRKMRATGKMLCYQAPFCLRNKFFWDVWDEWLIIYLWVLELYFTEVKRTLFFFLASHIFIGRLWSPLLSGDAHSWGGCSRRASQSRNPQAELGRTSAISSWLHSQVLGSGNVTGSVLILYTWVSSFTGLSTPADFTDRGLRSVDPTHLSVFGTACGIHY